MSGIERSSQFAIEILPQTGKRNTMFHRTAATSTTPKQSLQKTTKNSDILSSSSLDTEETEGLLLLTTRDIESNSCHKSNNAHATIVTSRSSSAPSSPNHRVKGSSSSPLNSHAKDTVSINRQTFNLLFGAGGIYGAYLYYGTLQEDVFNHVGSISGERFRQAWMLMVVEALANVIVGYIGMLASGGMTQGLSKKQFAITGATQVSAKAFTSLALANGLSFPVATLAKSGKMAPVMLGSLFLGGASYSFREYAQVFLVICGTAIVSMGKKKSNASIASSPPSSSLGILFIILSLVMDGVTAGVQKRLKREAMDSGSKPKSYDFMFWTNMYMMLTGLVVSTVIGDLSSGWIYCTENPEIWNLIVKFSLCSALGQSFIFFTIANFDPLVCTTVTTTRKIFSVLLSIFLKGHHLSVIGWGGIVVAVSGILGEVHGKCSSRLRKN